MEYVSLKERVSEIVPPSGREGEAPIWLGQLEGATLAPTKLERVRGIEPLSIAWKAIVIAIIRHPRDEFGKLPRQGGV